MCSFTLCKKSQEELPFFFFFQLQNVPFEKHTFHITMVVNIFYTSLCISYDEMNTESKTAKENYFLHIIMHSKP